MTRRLRGSVPRRALLEREIPVRLQQMNGAGCVLVSQRPLATGTSGVLRIELQGRQLSDEVQIVRCQALAGAGDRYRVEVAFLWVTPPGDESLRHVVAQLGLDPLTGDDARLVMPWA